MRWFSGTQTCAYTQTWEKGIKAAEVSLEYSPLSSDSREEVIALALYQQGTKHYYPYLFSIRKLGKQADK